MAPRHLLTAAMLAGTMFFSHHASAFTVDEKSGTNSDGSPRYVDPDDQPLPFPFLRLPSPSQGREYQGDDSQSVSPADRNEQWLTLPDWSVSSPSPRR
jgi:hypothetical protein